jgi:predicted O-linked N-acetylglucosamine transferase (SPINDLY family)
VNPSAGVYEEALRHHRSGRLAEAERLYREVLAADDRHADSLHLLGVLAHQVGKNDAAAALIAKAIEINTAEAAYHSNLGLVLQALTRLDDALACYETAIRLKPDYAEALSNRGTILKLFERHGDALASYEAALLVKPDFAIAHTNRGTTLRTIGRLKEACASYEAALRIKPDHLEAHSNLIIDLHYGSDVDESAIVAAAQRFARLYKPASPALVNPPDPDRRLRIGYVSGDFGRHSVAYFLAPVLANHDHQAFEIVCYPTCLRDDEMTAGLRSSADRWQSLVGVSDQAAAERIMADGVDILIDLSGHTAFNRLPVFARKPAPIQVTWLGFSGTTGLDSIDYRVVDAITDPKDGTTGWTRESLFRLTGGFLCYDPPAEAPNVAPPPCLDGAVTFGSFNNPAKLSVATLEAWGALLARVPDAKLLLKGRPFKDEAARALLIERLGTHGVPVDRIELLGWAPDPGGHLGLYRRVDIALDPFPYNGTTTTCEALWMGVPVVTLEGQRHSGRVGASLLTRIGLPELIATDIDDYIGIATNLAADRPRLRDLRQELRPRMRASPLCDGPAFTRDLEAAFRAMWQGWCERAAPPADQTGAF